MLNLSQEATTCVPKAVPVCKTKPVTKCTTVSLNPHKMSTKLNLSRWRQKSTWGYVEIIHNPGYMGFKPMLHGMKTGNKGLLGWIQQIIDMFYVFSIGNYLCSLLGRNIGNYQNEYRQITWEENRKLFAGFLEGIIWKLSADYMGWM